VQALALLHPGGPEGDRDGRRVLDHGERLADDEDPQELPGRQVDVELEQEHPAEDDEMRELELQGQRHTRVVRAEPAIRQT
jgi:hypothetical protein